MAGSYRVFRGNLYAVGLKPDGDTLTFRAHDRAALAALPDTEGNPGTVQFNPDTQDSVSVRLQGIDTLETHYQPVVTDPKPAGASTPVAPKPSAGNHHQRTDLARAATHALLGMLGVTVTDSDWHSWGYLRRVSVQGTVVTEKFQENVEVVIVAEGADSKGRVLGWVFPGTASLTEGQILTEAELASQLKTSCNSQMLYHGLAWPYFYLTLSTRLRAKLSTQVAAAQRAGRGLWPLDTTQSGTVAPTVTSLNDTAVLMPYLFRKVLRAWRIDALATWWAGGDVSAAALEVLRLDRLFSSGNPFVYTISDRQFLRLSDIIQIDNGTLRMTRKPQDVVFLE